MSRNKSKKRKPSVNNITAIRAAYDRERLRTICQLDEDEFGAEFDLDRYSVEQNAPNDFFYFKDRGSKILAVAHLDTVARAETRECHFVPTEAGSVVFSRALDDRLGAYVILDLLPKLGITCDILLTTGEETGQSTARYFTAEKEYNWIIEFDRGGTDIVMYQYEDITTRNLVYAAGGKVGDGIFSDISLLDHLKCKAFNWGVGYQDYHTARSHAYLEDVFKMVSQFMVFHAANAKTHLPHVEYSDFDLDDDWRGGHFGGSRSLPRGGWAYPGNTSHRNSRYNPREYEDWWVVAAQNGTTPSTAPIETPKQLALTAAADVILDPNSPADEVAKALAISLEDVEDSVDLEVIHELEDTGLQVRFSQPSQSVLKAVFDASTPAVSLTKTKESVSA